MTLMRPRVSIHPATPADAPAWDAFVVSHPEGLATHRWAWMASIREAYGFTSLPLVAERHGSVVGVFPIVVLRYPWGVRWAVSVPYGDVGGPLADNETTATRLLDTAHSLLNEKSALPLKVRLAHWPFPDKRCPELFRPQKVRMTLELPETAEKLLKSLKAKVRSQVKKPIRDGLSAYTGGMDLVPTFWKIYARNMRDLGSPPHPLRWFKSIVKHFGSDATVAVVTMPEGTPAAAGITLRCGDTVTIPWASSLRQLNSWNPNMLLYWTVLSKAIQDGARKFDFGRSSPGQGTYKFKAQWGASEKALYWACWSDKGWVFDKAGLPHGDMLRRYEERALRCLPLWANNAAGAFFRKYIDL